MRWKCLPDDAYELLPDLMRVRLLPKADHSWCGELSKRQKNAHGQLRHFNEEHRLLSSALNNCNASGHAAHLVARRQAAQAKALAAGAIRATRATRAKAKALQDRATGAQAHCKITDKARRATRSALPTFANRTELAAAAKWIAYYRHVYGPSFEGHLHSTESRWPWHTSAAHMLYAAPLRAHGLYDALRRLSTDECKRYWTSCDGIPTTLGRYKLFDPPTVLWLRQRDRSTAPSNTWVEVSHCVEKLTYHYVEPTALRPSAMQQQLGAWYYITPGTGIWWNVGRTRSFHTHYDAVEALVGPLEPPCYMCHGQMNSVVQAAIAAGLDSLQFTDHDDQTCGNMAVELLDVRGVGRRVCSSSGLRRGWLAAEPCECVEPPRSSPRASSGTSGQHMLGRNASCLGPHHCARV